MSGAYTCLSKEDRKKYQGEFVAIKNYKETAVLSSHGDEGELRIILKKKGVNSCTVFYVPTEGEIEKFKLT